MNKHVRIDTFHTIHPPKYLETSTPTPWDYVPSTEHHGPYITSNYGGTIADLYIMTHPSEPSVRNGGRSKPVSFFHEMADPNAELIVRAVNCHAELVAALQEARDALFKIRKCSIAGAEEGYGKPELWCDALFVSHGDVASALKTIDTALEATKKKQ